MSAGPPAPAPHRRDYGLLWMLGAVILVAGVLVFTGVYALSRYMLSHLQFGVRETAAGKSLEIGTPAGSVELKTGRVPESGFGLPLYPGAHRSQEHGATVSVQVPSGKALQVIAAEYETGDSLDQVAGYYRRELGSTFSERRQREHVEFFSEIGAKKKAVVLRRDANLTRIALINMTEAGAN